MIAEPGRHSDEPLLVHATTVALGPVAAMLRGPPGSGKSDLALRFLSSQSQGLSIPEHRGLVADDQTELRLVGGELVASAPARIAGLIEVRGMGIIPVGAAGATRVRLVIDLVAPTDVERLPLSDQTVCWLGCSIPLRRLAPFESSAPLKVALWLAGFAGNLDASGKSVQRFSRKKHDQTKS
jgi:HPr kinase/phosphorylase